MLTYVRCEVFAVNSRRAHTPAYLRRLVLHSSKIDAGSRNAVSNPPDESPTRGRNAVDNPQNEPPPRSHDAVKQLK